MSVLHSLIGRRHFLVTSLIGTIGAFLPAAAHTGTIPASAAGAETLTAPRAMTRPDAPRAGAAVIAAAAMAQPSGDTSLRPFHFHAPDEALEDLRRRIAATKWPGRETVTDASQGVQLATMQKLARYWETDYDWRKVEARLNALPQFITEIDGLDVHFIHVRSKHANALPLIVTTELLRSWPSSPVSSPDARRP